jgi:hypothetical protein
MTDFGLADELFLVGHNEYSGKEGVNADVLDTGLAGAVLGEAILQRRVVVTNGRVTVDDPRPWGDPVTDAVIREVVRRGDSYVPRAWIEHLRSDVRDVVGRRLVAAGMVQREESKVGLTRRSLVRYRAIDPLQATRPLVRVSHFLQRPEHIDAQTATLAGIIRSTGLEHRVMLEWSRQEILDGIGAIVIRLPQPLRELLAGLDATVSAMAVITRR